MAWRSGSLRQPIAVFSCRRSMISTLGIGRPPTRMGIEISEYRPRWAFRQDSSEGVAEPSSTGIPSIWARLTADVARVVSRRRLLLEGAFMLFVDDDEAQPPGRRKDRPSAPPR